jgi:quercetin dioxygenase-like cupin family protein
LRALSLLLLGLPLTTLAAQTPGFGVCKPVAQRSSEAGCWILVDQPVGRAQATDVYWHLDSYEDSTHALRDRSSQGVVVRALGKTWLMTFDTAPSRQSVRGVHVADIGPLRVTAGREYSAVLMEAITAPGFTSAIHRHSGPEAWYTIAGETCLETPAGKIVGRPGVPAIVPQGPPMFLTATGENERRAITLILHDAAQAPTTMEHEWKPRGLCR